MNQTSPQRPGGAALPGEPQTTPLDPAPGGGSTAHDAPSYASSATPPGFSPSKAAAPAGTAGAADRRPNWPTVFVGLFCILVALLVVLRELVDWQINWAQLGPATLIGLGVALVVLGSLGLLRRRK